MRHIRPDPCRWYHGRPKCVPSTGFSWLESSHLVAPTGWNCHFPPQPLLLRLLLPRLLLPLPSSVPTRNGPTSFLHSENTLRWVRTWGLLRTSYSSFYRSLLHSPPRQSTRRLAVVPVPYSLTQSDDPHSGCKHSILFVNIINVSRRCSPESPVLRQYKMAYVRDSAILSPKPIRVEQYLQGSQFGMNRRISAHEPVSRLPGNQEPKPCTPFFSLLPQFLCTNVSVGCLSVDVPIQFTKVQYRTYVSLILLKDHYKWNQFI